jgi:hypothetical protein
MSLFPAGRSLFVTPSLSRALALGQSSRALSLYRSFQRARFWLPCLFCFYFFFPALNFISFYSYPFRTSFQLLVLDVWRSLLGSSGTLAGSRPFLTQASYSHISTKDCFPSFLICMHWFLFNSKYFAFSLVPPLFKYMFSLEMYALISKFLGIFPDNIVFII